MGKPVDTEDMRVAPEAVQMADSMREIPGVVTRIGTGNSTLTALQWNSEYPAPVNTERMLPKSAAVSKEPFSWFTQSPWS